jgi:hypothetical protein
MFDRLTPFGQVVLVLAMALVMLVLATYATTIFVFIDEHIMLPIFGRWL